MAIGPGARIGPYEVMALLGEGGMGKVWRAHHTGLKRDDALKVLPEAFASDPERLARFQREAQVLASLNHPNIAHVYGLEESDGTKALVMELVEGPTLADRIAKGPAPIDEALAIAKQIAEALEAAHEQGIVHRDLKPANIKLRPDGTVKVLDFGLAKAVEPVFSASPSVTASPTMTSPALMSGAGMLLGTAAYMSPEQARGRPVDRRADVWAFGCVLFEMATGRQAFRGETITETLASVLKEEPEWGPVPASLRRVLRVCLAKDPKQRLSAIGDWQLLLDEFSQVAAEASSQRTGIAPWILSAALFAALVGVSFLYFRKSPPDVPTFTYIVAPPENSFVHSFAISPDARYLVLAGGTAGKRQLWLRPLDALQWQPLLSTDGASFPFWSPDSRAIGFASDGKLKRILLGGGPPQTLCDCDAITGSWSQDDVILFQTNARELKTIPAIGGSPSELLKTDVFQGRFLPGARRYFYALGTAGTAEGLQVHITSVGSSEDRLILSNVSSYAFSRGYLLFTRQTTLMAQRFDVSAGRPSGDAFPVADGVSMSPRGPYTPVVASTNGVIVHVSAERQDSSRIGWVDRSGRPFGSGTFPGRTPAISPDGKSIAYARITDSSPADLWLRDARETDSRLTRDAGVENQPLWSPRGDRLMYRAARGLAQPGELYRIDISGGRPESLLTTGRNKIPSQWSRDGRWIVYTEPSSKTGFDIWALSVDDGAPGAQPIQVVHSDFNDFQGQLSPDSRWIAYTSEESGQREVYVRAFPSGDGRQKISNNGGAQPRWRGDGMELYFVTAAGAMTAVGFKPVPGPTPAFQLGAAVPLFDTRLYDGGMAYEYDVTADGQRFLVNTNVAGAYSTPLTVIVNWDAALKK
jgi:eukaryotic-like serine/threonine-protein kinase